MIQFSVRLIPRHMRAKGLVRRRRFHGLTMWITHGLKDGLAMKRNTGQVQDLQPVIVKMLPSFLSGEY